MAHEVPEADWRTFRKLRDAALDRFCERTLEQIDAVRSDSARSHHERYIAIVRLLNERDAELARTFDDPRRSRMIIQLAVLYSLDLLLPGEVASFSTATRAQLEVITKGTHR